MNFSENKIVKINSIFAYGYTHGKVKLAGKLITKKVSEMIGLKVKIIFILIIQG